jgi:hypothetical protein
MAPPQAIAGGGRSSAAAVKVPTINAKLVAETAASTPSDHLIIATNGQGRNEALLGRFAGVMGLWKASSNRHMPSNQRFGNSVPTLPAPPIVALLAKHRAGPASQRASKDDVVRSRGAIFASEFCQPRHCEPTGPARSGRPDDKLREAIQSSIHHLDCFVATLLAMTTTTTTK